MAFAERPMEAAEHLRRLAGVLTGVYLVHRRPDAIFLTGRQPPGVFDHCSDLDLIVYYSRLPSESSIAGARVAASGDSPGLLAPHTDQAYGETFVVDGVQCQVVHGTIAAWEQELHAVLVDHDVESPLQKAIAGLHDGIALHGGDLIERWRAQAEYPDGLARAPIDQTQDCNLAELRPCATGLVR